MIRPFRPNRFLRYGICGLTLATLMFLVNSFMNYKVFQKPKCVIKNKLMHVSARPGEGKVQTVLKVANGGGGTLRILKVSTSCGCTVASVTPNSLRTDEEATISLEGDVPPAGDKRVEITVSTNDPETSEHTALFIMENLRPLPYVEQMPNKLNWSPFNAKDRLRFIVKAYEPPDSEIWLNSPLVDHKAFKVSGGLVSEHPGFGGKAIKREYQYSVELRTTDRDFSDLPRHAIIHLDGKSISDPSLSIPVAIEVEPMISVTPQRLHANIAVGQKSQKFSVVIMANHSDKEPLNVQMLTNINGVTCQKKFQSHNKQVLEITIDTSLKDLDYRQISGLEFSTNVPDLAKIRLPVTLNRL